MTNHHLVCLPQISIDTDFGASSALDFGASSCTLSGGTPGCYPGIGGWGYLHQLGHHRPEGHTMPILKLCWAATLISATLVSPGWCTSLGLQVLGPRTWTATHGSVWPKPGGAVGLLGWLCSYEWTFEFHGFLL